MAAPWPSFSQGCARPAAALCAMPAARRPCDAVYLGSPAVQLGTRLTPVVERAPPPALPGSLMATVTRRWRACWKSSRAAPLSWASLNLLAASSRPMQLCTLQRACWPLPPVRCPLHAPAPVRASVRREARGRQRGRPVAGRVHALCRADARCACYLRFGACRAAPRPPRHAFCPAPPRLQAATCRCSRSDSARARQSLFRLTDKVRWAGRHGATSA